jgi:eukaryotic-like serine/threonine-protein kinase
MPTERAKQLFGEAVELPLTRRAAFLAAACQQDGELHAMLERLLAAHEAAGDFLDHPRELVDAAAAHAPEPDGGLCPGDRIGGYELVARLGSGGFGSVWRARQLAPVVREVAWKVLHRAVDGERVAWRFEVERQALARMQHPGIARIFDAGTTPDGRPWLSMELIDGVPITRFVLQRGLSLPSRLRLFVEVCLAVQHAHGKGVVHRDLKPSNVLVVERDGEARPVVIDFGVAHALDDEQRRGDESTPAGTPDYMSPEQAADARGAIDARSDVWSLGVLLHELACGARPFVRGESEPVAALLRRISTESPLPPSVRSDLRLPPEIDWIVARAMAKEPADRYATAVSLAEDVRRLLAGEPVLAGPAGTPYRVRKFVGRHRLAVVAVTLVLATLVVATWVSARGWADARAAEARERVSAQAAREGRQRAEREATRSQRTLAVLEGLWAGVDPSRLGRTDYPVRELLADFERTLPERLAEEPSVELPIRRTLARLHNFVGAAAEAEAHATRAIELATQVEAPVDLVAALLQRARVRFERGDAVGAEADADRALVATGTDPAFAAPAATAREVLANCRARGGDTDGAAVIARDVLEARLAIGDTLEVARSQMQLANLAGTAGRIDEAVTWVDQALASLAPLGDDHPDAIVALQHLAHLHQRRGDFAAAEASFRESLARRRRVYGDDHANVAWAEADLAWTLHERGDHAAAAELLRTALPKLRQRLGDGHLYFSEAIHRLGTVSLALRDFATAEKMLADAAARYRSLPGHPVEGLVGALGNIAKLHWARDERATAIATQREALAASDRSLPATHFLASVGRTNLAFMLSETGDLTNAIALLAAALEQSGANGRTGEAKLQRQRLVELLRRAGRDDEARVVEAGK